jgi:hypothetical protein
VAEVRTRIEEVKVLHDGVTRHSRPEQHIIGFVLHSEKIEVSAEPCNFTHDWALIELYDDKVD